MAINLHYLASFVANGQMKAGDHVLDIGCSNLYNAGEAEVVDFMASLGVEDAAFAADVARGSADKSYFAGELLDRCGVHYTAIDFAVDYKTIKFDLNHDALPWKMRRSFDLVMNFGTTEHVINQAHAFDVIHSAAKSDGRIFHQLPCSGYFDHCYFLYTSRFFCDMAGYNKYDIEELSFSQGNESDLMKTVADYSTLFPALKNTQAVAEMLAKDTGISVMYRKTHGGAFVNPMEMSTAYTKPDA